MTSTPQNTSRRAAPPPPTVWPSVRARDAHALIDFLVGTVGFLRTAVYEEDGRVVHAQLDWPEGGGIMLGSCRDDDAVHARPGSLSAYVVTDHVDELYARVTAAGARIQRELVDQPYGSREFSMADPEGNSWSFGTYRGEPRAE